MKIPESGLATVESNLRNEFIGDDDNPRMQLARAVWNLQIDAVEEMILALGCAGVDLGSPEFCQGLEVALGSIAFISETS